ncbi:MAG: tyrosine-type recombinase/integrase [Anaerolineales bacterium]|nr:tyrosine-type recombinase/integrase [Anaerolineales bacterium]
MRIAVDAHKLQGRHTFRHSLATHLFEKNYNIRIVQELLGHRRVKKTMIYTHGLSKGPYLVLSPLYMQPKN